MSLIIDYFELHNMIMMMNCFCGIVDRRKVFSLISSRHQRSEILTIANLRHAASRIWTCTEPEFRLYLMKLCISDNHYTTVPKVNANISLYKFFNLYFCFLFKTHEIGFFCIKKTFVRLCACYIRSLS